MYSSVGTARVRSTYTRQLLLKGRFSKSNDKAPLLSLMMDKAAKLVLPAPLAYHKLMRNVFANQTVNSTQEIADLQLDFNYTASLLRGPEDFSASLLGLEEGDVGQDVQNNLKYNGANASLTDAFFTALRSIPSYNFSSINLTGYSSIIGPVLLLKAREVNLHNSVITADGLGFTG